MVSKNGRNEHIDADILRCKADILRIKQLKDSPAADKQQTSAKDVPKKIKPPGAAASTPGVIEAPQKPSVAQQAKLTEQPPPKSRPEQAELRRETVADVQAELKQILAQLTAAAQGQLSKHLEEIIGRVQAEQEKRLQEITAARTEQAKILEHINASGAEQQACLQQTAASAEAKLAKLLDEIIAAARTEKDRCLEEITAQSGQDVKIIEDIASVARDKGRDRAGIPKFDLAEQMMAEQRKIAAVKRKAPGRKAEPQTSELPAEFAHAAAEQEKSFRPLFQQGSQQNGKSGIWQPQIIAEIVAADIERLCNRPMPREKSGSK